MVMSLIRDRLRYARFITAWRRANPLNETRPANLFDMTRVRVGPHSYGPLEVHDFGEENAGLTIGSFCSIAAGVRFVLGGNHRHDTMFTFPFKVKIAGAASESWSKGPIVVGDDVWIGMHAMILSGVRVGKGAVIAAGSVVTHDVEPFAIVAGNPAFFKRFRFSENIRQKLLQRRYEDIDIARVARNVDALYERLDEEEADRLIAEFFPQRKE